LYLILNTNKKMGSFIIYDNNCNLCKASVEFLRKRDRKKRIDFISLDSLEARQVLKAAGVQFMQKNTVYFVHENKAYVKSTAVLRSLSLLPFPYSWLTHLRIFPLFIRDGVYNFIARNRYRFN
jgi:predicted DCC family thiol-disulfide oxidoreductase YuxK